MDYSMSIITKATVSKWLATKIDFRFFLFALESEKIKICRARIISYLLILPVIKTHTHTHTCDNTCVDI